MVARGGGEAGRRQGGAGTGKPQKKCAAAEHRRHLLNCGVVLWVLREVPDLVVAVRRATLIAWGGRLAAAVAVQPKERAERTELRMQILMQMARRKVQIDGHRPNRATIGSRGHESKMR